MLFRSHNVLLLLAGWLALHAPGCSRQAELAFSPRAELAEFPAKHQSQIAAALEKHFGTARSPRFLVLAPEDQQPADATEPLLIDKFDRLQLAHGRDVYSRQCAGCHGVTGDGLGPAAKYLDPAPRDYRLGKFKFASTPRGTKPRREDLARIIRRGAKGTSMPTFRFISDEDLEAVIDYVVLLSSRGEMEYRLMKASEQELGEEDDIPADMITEQVQNVAATWAAADDFIVRPLTPQTKATPENIAAGAKAFVELNCYKCHGRDGRGNRVQDVGKDDWGRVAFAADLTTGMLHGGRRPVDIYRRIYAGINGTPMPAFAQPDSTKNETEAQRSETIWNMVHFVTSVVEGQPLPQEVIDAAIKTQLEEQQKLQQAAGAETPAAGGG
jgi:mono/diheme cytochrome c family protein